MALRKLMMGAAALALWGAPLFAAADSRVTLTLDGRPLSRKPDVALVRNGTIFVDAVDLTRVLNGLLLFGPRDSIKLVIAGHTATFRAGRRTANVDGKTVTLPQAAFVHNGDVYVPITALIGKQSGISLRKISRTHADLHVAVFTTPSPEGSSSPSPALALALAPTASAASDGLHVMLSVRNTLDAPITLAFSSGARVIFSIDRNGATIWNSAEGKRYTQSLSSVTLAAGQAVTYSDLWPGWNDAPPGRYQLQARLMVRPPIDSSPVSLGVK